MNDEIGLTFEQAAANPRVWQQAARDFLRAGNYLLDWYDPPREAGDASDLTYTHGGTAPIFVLYAAAVENLLKACRVAKDGSPLIDGKLPKEFANHDLVTHAKKAGVLQAGDSEFLSHLADFMVGGRYPLPLHQGGTPGAWQFSVPGDVERLWSLFERLEVVLAGRCQPPLSGFDARTRFRPIGYDLVDEGASVK